MSDEPRALLIELFERAVAGADPGPATARAVSALPLAGERRVHVIATGKAASAMAAAAVDALRSAGVPGVRGVVVTHDAALPSPQGLARVTADHPVPGRASLAAAEAVGRAVQEVANDELVLVLLSGGTSSLVAAPVDGVSPAELRALHESLQALGLPIGEMNALRKRWAAWGAGRLAGALSHARVECMALSDVPGDAAADIGSGPCVGDEWTATALLDLLASREVAGRLPPAFLRWLKRVAGGEIAETPKPGDARLARARVQVIASNRTALDAAAAHCTELGIISVTSHAPLVGDARSAGKRIALQLLKAARAGGEPRCFLWGGETTVALASGAAPAGGRAQELALSAARTLHSARPSVPVTLLSAGTDGRDGTTDAAGAIVDAGSWKAMQEANAVPERALVQHESYAALRAAGLLLQTGPTGTNVMDVVIALVGALAPG